MKFLLIGLAVLGLAAPVGANHPQACYLDLGAAPDARASRKCVRWQARLCRLCQRYPGMTLCQQHDICDSHNCVSYTPTDAECAVGHRLPECAPATTTTGSTYIPGLP